MYDKSIDKKWQKIWEYKECFKALEDFTKEKFFALVEFPYPSGAGLHVGHVRAYMSLETISRMKRMQGYNVLFPLGFDAFGLPTENYAMKTKIHPRIVTDNNIEIFSKELKSVGFSFDWDKTTDTTDPNYYKWTQWIFLKLFEHGLAYKNTTFVNYCPNCRVILANEESQGGKCDRCDSEIEQKEKEVWMLKITDYADKLLDGLDKVDFAPRVRLEQENWIGRSYGLEVDFKIAGKEESFRVYTTRPDTIFGVTYMAIAPEHPLLKKFKEDIANYDDILDYAKAAKLKTEFERVELVKDKTGVQVKGIEIINPLSNEKIPLFVTDYVMMGYGTGAIMAVPAHDDRDYEFAKKFGVKIKQVIAPVFEDNGKDKMRENVETIERNTVDVLVKHWEEDKYIILDWKKSLAWKTLIKGGVEDNETTTQAAIREVREETGYIDIESAEEILNAINESNFFAAHKGVNRIAKSTPVIVKLASPNKLDVSCEELEKHTARWVSKEELLNELEIEAQKYIVKMYFEKGPYIDKSNGVIVNSGFLNGMNVEDGTKSITDYIISNNIGSKKTNYHMKDWAFARQRYWGEPVPIVKCSKCGLVPLPEKDLPLTLPDIEDFMPGEDGESPLASIDSWVNTTCPKCGLPAKRETDTMPQWAGSSWYYLRYIDPRNDKEFAAADKMKYWLSVDCYNGGMEHVTRHLIYSRFWHKFMYDIGIVPTEEPYMKRTTQGLILGSDGNKMSKSKGNVVSPNEIVNEFGADTLRTYILFIGEYSLSAPWSENGVKGAKKFLDRVARLDSLITDEDTNSSKLDRELNIMIKKVTSDYEEMKFNTAIAAMMTYVNILYKEEKISKKYVMPLLQILNPVAPHITEELWEQLGFDGYIFETKFPKYDETKIVLDTLEIPVQVNGVLRYKISVNVDMTEEEVTDIVKSSSEFNTYVGNKEIKKIIVIKNKIVNIVVV